MVVVMLVVILYWCESCVVLVNLVKLEVIVVILVVLMVMVLSCASGLDVGDTDSGCAW